MTQMVARELQCTIAPVDSEAFVEIQLKWCITAYQALARNREQGEVTANNVAQQLWARITPACASCISDSQLLQRFSMTSHLLALLVVVAGAACVTPSSTGRSLAESLSVQNCQYVAGSCSSSVMSTLQYSGAASRAQRCGC
jgi:hypothetical protein